jgi:hypothetical protein
LLKQSNLLSAQVAAASPPLSAFIGQASMPNNVFMAAVCASKKVQLIAPKMIAKAHLSAVGDCL